MSTLPVTKTNFVKKIILTLATSFYLLASSLALPASTLAQQTPYQSWQETLNHKWYSEQDPFSWYAKVYDSNSTPDSEIFGERYTAAQVQWVIYGLFAHIWNFIPGNPEITICARGGDASNCWAALQKYWDALNPLTQNNDKALAGVFSFVGQNPISGVYYFKSLGSKLSLVPEVKAQGFGYLTGVNAIQGIWQAARNISFMLIIIAVIILAFMIMFQVKINPQVVITVQSALPKLIITLILITFSYAIAGLAIDLMYLIIGAISVVLVGAGLTNHTTIEMFQSFTTTNDVFSLLYKYWGAFLVAALSTLGTSATGYSILLIILAILSILAIIWWSIKIIFIVFKNLAMILLTIVVGPLEIALGSLTSSSGFGSWFKKLLSYLIFYPVVGFMFFLAFLFLFQGIGDGTGDSFATAFPFNPKMNVASNNPWVPPLSKVAISGNTDSVMWIIISFFIISQITKVSEIIQSFIQGKPFAYGTGLSEAQNVTKGVGSMAADYQKLIQDRVVAAPGQTAQGIINAIKWLAVIIPK